MVPDWTFNVGSQAWILRFYHSAVYSRLFDIYVLIVPLVEVSLKG